MIRNKLSKADNESLNKYKRNLSECIEQNNCLHLDDSIKSAMDFYDTRKDKYSDEVRYQIWMTFAETLLHTLVDPVTLESKQEDYNPIYDVDMFIKEIDIEFLQKNKFDNITDFKHLNPKYQAYYKDVQPVYEHEGVRDYIERLWTYTDNSHNFKYFNTQKGSGDYNRRVIKPLCDLAIMHPSFFIPLLFNFSGTNSNLLTKMPLYIKGYQDKSPKSVYLTPFQYIEYVIGHPVLLNKIQKGEITGISPSNVTGYLDIYFDAFHREFSLYAFYQHCAALEAFPYIRKYMKTDRYDNHLNIIDILKDNFILKGGNVPENQSYIKEMNLVACYLTAKELEEKSIDLKP